ncbi:MAG: hypothetical protein Q9M30_04005 [Mariprofundaceae bacterium]|nr:hypothetical protein [Mariprofundaceae bacterium]
MKFIRKNIRFAVFIGALFVAMAGLSACGGGSGTATTTTTGAGVSGSGA